MIFGLFINANTFTLIKKRKLGHIPLTNMRLNTPTHIQDRSTRTQVANNVKHNKEQTLPHTLKTRI